MLLINEKKLLEILIGGYLNCQLVQGGCRFFTMALKLLKEGFQKLRARKRMGMKSIEKLSQHSKIYRKELRGEKTLRARWGDLLKQKAFLPKLE